MCAGMPSSQKGGGVEVITLLPSLEEERKTGAVPGSLTEVNDVPGAKDILGREQVPISCICKLFELPNNPKVSFQRIFINILPFNIKLKMREVLYCPSRY